MRIHHIPCRIVSLLNFLEDFLSYSSQLDSIGEANVDILKGLPNYVQLPASLTTAVAPPLDFINGVSRQCLFFHYQGFSITFRNKILLTTTNLESVN